MSAFKVGDRVRYTGKRKAPSYIDWSTSPKVGRVGTVASVAAPGVVDVSWDSHPDGGRGIFSENLELVEPEKPAVGDRVRVVHEGVVTYADKHGFNIETESGKGVYAGRAMKSVEILERKPEEYPVGTIARNVMSSTALPLIRDEEGWRLHSGELAEFVTDERVRGNMFEVIYEPPTT